jgi:hypothetical protein
MAKAQIILGELGGGNESVVEFYSMAKVNASLGAQILVNDTTNEVNNNSHNWTGNYIGFDQSTYSVYAIQKCKVSYKIEDAAWVTTEVNAGDTIFTESFQAQTIGKAVMCCVLAEE